MNRLFIFIAICLLAPFAHADDVGTNGKYFTYNGTKYMTKGAEAVSSPGQIGSVTGKGLTGFFYPNGFGHIGFTTSGGAMSGTEFLVDGSILAIGNGNLHLASAKKVNVEVDADATINVAKTYKGLFVSVNDWAGVIKELNEIAKTKPAGSPIYKKNFRVVESVLYATAYSKDSKVTLNGKVKLELDAGKRLTVSGTITGEAEKTDTLVLSDGSTIAYSMRHVCWQGGKIVDIVPDVLGKARPGVCKNYK